MPNNFIKNSIAQSPTAAINSLAQKKIARGETVYNLGIGEPMMPTHPLVIDAAEQAMKRGKTHYSPTMGIPELRAAASDWMNRIYDTSYSADETLATCGGKFGLFALCKTVLGIGDEGIIIAPYWVSYPSLIGMTGAKVTAIQTSKNASWKITPQQLRSAITPRAKIIFFNNASNPTGVLYSREEIKELISIAVQHNILFVSDEVYSALEYDAEFVSAGSFPEYRDSVVVVQSVSKHFAMTGWRVGIVFGNAELLKSLGDWQSQSTSGTSTISQWAAVAAFNNGENISDMVGREMKSRRDLLVSLLQKEFAIQIDSPQSGLYVLISLKDLGSAETDSAVFCERVLSMANVALVPGAPFGAEGYARISFGGNKEESESGIIALADYLKKQQ